MFCLCFHLWKSTSFQSWQNEVRAADRPPLRVPAGRSAGRADSPELWAGGSEESSAALTGLALHLCALPGLCPP